MSRTGQQRQVFGYSATAITVAVATVVLKLVGAQINPTTVALMLLLIVVLVATASGPRPAILAALLAVLCFNFFFLPPLHTFTVADPENWIALVAFLITAITVGQLSARAKQRANEADAARREIERLYRELQDTFERASQAKALQQSERLKAALLDAVTHDLRTPLTSIKASITTLLDESRMGTEEEPNVGLDAKSRLEMLEIINEETDRLNHFISDLIELARIEAGELGLRLRWGAVDEIVAAAVSRAESLTRGHQLQVNIEDELPVVRVDEKAVSEVVYNLIENATKYSPQGSTIGISVRRANDEMIEMAVVDEGEGIPIELRERVFDKFFRALRDGDVKTAKPAGTGMGLAIAKGIVEAHDGKIWVEGGAGGQGTRVIFALPIGAEEHPSTDVSEKSVSAKTR